MVKAGAKHNDVDTLFTLPLADFTGGRNALASQLKREGRGREAEEVKALTKPSLSAWAVNQLFWKQRNAFDQLIETGRQYRDAQASTLKGVAADLNGPLMARRAVLSDLLRLAASLLGDAGHSPTPDTLRRITNTLEALSTESSGTDGPTPGRLTNDIDPPGFDALASLLTAVSSKTQPPVRMVSPPEPREAKKASQERLEAARKTLHAAEQALKEMRKSEENARAAVKKAEAQKREAEERFEQANQQAQSIAAEVKRAEQAVEEAAGALQLLKDV